MRAKEAEVVFTFAAFTPGRKGRTYRPIKLLLLSDLEIINCQEQSFKCYLVHHDNFGPKKIDELITIKV